MFSTFYISNNNNKTKLIILTNFDETKNFIFFLLKQSLTFFVFNRKKNSFYYWWKLIETKFQSFFSADIWFAFEQSRERNENENIDHYWITMVDNLILQKNTKIEMSIVECRMSKMVWTKRRRRIKNSIWLVRSNRHTGHQDLFVWKIWKKSKED